MTASAAANSEPVSINAEAETNIAADNNDIASDDNNNSSLVDSLVGVCHNCGAKNSPDVNFCGSCGAKLTS